MIYPKISIVTVSYNQGQFLEQTILSVLSQNYPNLEYIIIDGGSTDNSVEIIKKYQDRISYWISEKDNGQYDAINRGFAHATGEIFGFLNSDDIFYPWTLKTLASIFGSHSHVDWVTSLCVSQINSDGVIISKGTLNPISKKAFIDGLYIPGVSGLGVITQEGTFWRSSLWHKVGGIDLSQRLAGDFDLWCNFMKHTIPYSVELPLAAMTRHEEQRSNQQQQYIKECRDALNALKKFLNNKDDFNSKLRIFLLRNLPNKRVFWSIAKYIYSYKCSVLDSFFNSDTFELKWKESEMIIYKKN